MAAWFFGDAASKRSLHAYIAAFQEGEPLIAYCAGPAHRDSLGPALVPAVQSACCSSREALYLSALPCSVCVQDRHTEIMSVLPETPCSCSYGSVTSSQCECGTLHHGLSFYARLPLMMGLMMHQAHLHQP